MSPEMMAKRHLLPLSGPQEPVSAAVATFVASVTVEAVVTGAIIGAVGAAITGGDILKGALLGGLGGALTSGMGGVMAGEAGAVAAELPGSVEAVNGMDLASDLATQGATQTGTIGTSGLQNINQYGTAFPGEAAGAQMTPAANAPLQSTGSSVASAKTTGEIAANTAGAGTSAAQNTGIAQGASQGLAANVVKGGTGLLNSAGDMVGKALSSPYGAAAAMQLGGALLTGKSADKRAEEQAAMAEAQRKRRATPINMTAEKWA